MNEVNDRGMSAAPEDLTRALPHRRNRQSRSDATRSDLLRAAEQVFTTYGYADANIADVVKLSQVSVGSLYHHFGGKSGLYISLFTDYQESQEKRAAEAVKAARATVPDPQERFLAGARAYLSGAWEQREVAALFLSGDTPAGFDVVRRNFLQEWIRYNSVLLGLDDSLRSRAFTVSLTTLIGEASREVSACSSEQDAHALVDEFIHLLGSLLTASSQRAAAHQNSEGNTP